MSAKPAGERDPWRVNRIGERYILVRGPRDNRTRATIEAKTRAEAEREAADWNLEEERNSKSTNLSVEELYDLYVDDRVRAGKDVNRMISAWRPMKSSFGHLRPDQVTDSVCRQYTTKRRDHGVTDGGIRTELSYLRQSFIFGHRKAYIEEAPHVERPPAGRPRERYLTREELTRLIDGAEAFHIKLFIIVSIATAGRPSHVLQLKWNRVDFTRRRINLDNLGERTKKGRALVPMNDEAYEAMTQAKQVSESDHVIEYAGKPVKSVKKGIAAAARRAGIVDVSPYVLRHTAGVLMAESGAPMEQIAQFMGHTNLEITRKHYAQYSPEYLSGLAEALTISPAKRQTPLITNDKSRQDTANSA